MPYSSVSELPQAVRDKYKPRCQRVFMDAFNNDYKRNRSETRAFQVAHTAARNCEQSTKDD